MTSPARTAAPTPAPVEPPKSVAHVTRARHVARAKRAKRAKPERHHVSARIATATPPVTHTTAPPPTTTAAPPGHDATASAARHSHHSSTELTGQRLSEQPELLHPQRTLKPAVNHSTKTTSDRRHMAALNTTTATRGPSMTDLATSPATLGRPRTLQTRVAGALITLLAVLLVFAVAPASMRNLPAVGALARALEPGVAAADSYYTDEACDSNGTLNWNVSETGSGLFNNFECLVGPRPRRSRQPDPGPSELLRQPRHSSASTRPVGAPPCPRSAAASKPTRPTATAPG